LALTLLALAASASFFIALDTTCQVAGLSAQFFLFLGQSAHIAAASGAPLDTRLALDQPIDLPQIRLVSGDFRGQLVPAGFTQQEFQKSCQVGFQFFLVIQGVGQFFFFEQLDEPFKLHVDQLFVAHLDGFSQEGRPARVLGGRQLGHAQKDLFEPTVPFGQGLLLGGKFFRGAGRLGPVGRSVGRSLFLFWSGGRIVFFVSLSALRPRAAPDQHRSGQQQHSPP